MHFHSNSLSKHCVLSKLLSAPHSPLTFNAVVFKIPLRPSFSEHRPILDYMHANCQLFRFTLDQLVVTNPRIRGRTDLEHTIQNFSSAVRQAAFTAIPKLTVRSHLLTLRHGLVNLMKLKNSYRRRYQRSGHCLFHLLHQLLSRVLYSRLNQLRNPKSASFLGTLHPQSKPKPFWKIARYLTTPTRTVPPLFNHGVQVLNSADEADLLAQHFERIHHLNLNVGTANEAHMVYRTFNNYFRRPHPHITEAQLANPYELRRLIQSPKTKPALGTDGISATMLWILFRKALIHLNQLFNHILRFGYFPYAWKSAKVIPILKPDKPPSDLGSHRPITLSSAVSKLLERVLAHRLNFRIHQNHILTPEQFGFRKQHSTVSQLARITDFIIHGFNLIKHTVMILLDIEKAYDTVRLNAPLFKLIHFNCRVILFSSLSPTWKVIPLLLTWMTLPLPQNYPLRCSTGCRTIDYTILTLSFWHAVPSAHPPRLIRRWHCPSLSALADWFYMPQTQ